MKRGNSDEKKQLISFLHKFIKLKSEKYDAPPDRKGIPRGEPIGFSQKKYEAALWVLTSLKLKAISKELEISYALLRKWTTEELFKKQIENNIRDYTNLFVRVTEEESVKWDKVFDDDQNQAEEEIVKSDFFFRDIVFYGPLLRASLLENLGILVDKHPSTGWFVFTIMELLFVTKKEGDNLGRTLGMIDFEHRMQSETNDLILEMLTPALLKVDPAPNERCEALNKVKKLVALQQKRKVLFDAVCNTLFSSFWIE